MSYAPDDQQIVPSIVNCLHHNDLVVWTNHKSFEEGTKGWEYSVQNAMRNSFAMILLVSPATREAPFVQHEISLAERFKRPIFTLWVRGEHWLECVPKRLSVIQVFDARAYPQMDALEQATSVLKKLGIRNLPDARSIPVKLIYREIQILHLLAASKSAAEIADELDIQIVTVRWYFRQINSKLDVHSQAEAIVRARQLKILD